MTPEWLPPLVLLEESGGDWSAYLEAIYACFHKDFVSSKPQWPGKNVGLKRHPLSQDKETTFWHFISEGSNEAERNVDFRRAERIRWPRPVMEAFPDRRPVSSDPIVWWKNERHREQRYLLALPDFSYLMVVADRGQYVLPWTQYCIEKPHQREKNRKEYEAYWAAQNS